MSTKSLITQARKLIAKRSLVPKPVIYRVLKHDEKRPDDSEAEGAVYTVILADQNVITDEGGALSVCDIGQ